MAVSQDYLDYIMDQLSSIEDITAKKMFGGVGFMKDGAMFGMISPDKGEGVKFRLKVDDSNRAQFEEHGMKPLFNPAKKRGMPYWEVPISIIEDRAALKKWAMQSYQIAISKKK